MAAAAKAVQIEIDKGEAVSGLLIQPLQPRACYVFAHGAGAGMTHPHSVSIFVAVVCVAGALFVLAAAAMVLVGQRSRPERGNLLSMSVMTAQMNSSTSLVSPPATPP